MVSLRVHRMVVVGVTHTRVDLKNIDKIFWLRICQR